MRSLLISVLICLSSLLTHAKDIEVFVCLCDNENQGIVKVGAKIGNGLDPANNLYWGCSDGLWRYFKKSKRWQLTETKKHTEGPILITLSFLHADKKTKLTAHAYRGDKMEKCIEDFLTKTRDASKDQLVAFIGHNGLMDTHPTIPEKAQKNDIPSDSIVLGCISDSYFTPHLESMNSRPLLLTRSLMYPGSFILHDAIEIWLKNGTKNEIRKAAAKAYANNQQISMKAAYSIFTKIDQH